MILLLGVTGTGLGVFKAIENSKKAALQQTPEGTFTGTKTAIYYFNRGLDCVTCERIGGVADETIRSDFAQQFKDGQLEVKKVDYLLPENRHFEKLFNFIRYHRHSIQSGQLQEIQYAKNRKRVGRYQKGH